MAGGPTPPWQEHRVLAEAIGQAYADAMTASVGTPVELGIPTSFDPDQMLGKRPVPLRATVVRFASPLRDVAILISSLKDEVITPLALAGAQRVLETFEINGDVEVDETAEYDDVATAIDQTDALWLEGTYQLELPTGEVRFAGIRQLLRQRRR
jgi:hypothetical protein